MTRDEVRAELSEAQTIALTLFGETRGEPLIGQLGVASVIRNRFLSGRWGRSYKAVCLAKFQFSCWNGDDENGTAVDALAAKVITGDAVITPQLMWIASGLTTGALVSDPTGGATNYLTSALYRQKPPKWAKGVPILATYGSHVFMSVA